MMGAAFSFIKKIKLEHAGDAALKSEKVTNVLRDSERCCIDQCNKTLFMSKSSMGELSESSLYEWCAKYFVGECVCAGHNSLNSKNIRYLLNTLYCCTKAFDAIFILLFTDSKAYDVLLAQKPSSSNRSISKRNVLLKSFVECIFKYVVLHNVSYQVEETESVKKCESVIDFPLKTLGLCPCTRRPIYVAVYMRRPDIVRMLLKYGAKIPSDDCCTCSDAPKHPLVNVLRFLKFINDIKSNVSSECTSVQSKLRDDVESLQLLLVDISCSSSLWRDVWNYLTDLDNVPLFECMTVPSLKHLCRREVRCVLRVRSCLPFGAELLSLPSSLVSYICLGN